MSTPFRSELEHVREQLRRSEERVQALTDENAEMVNASNVRGRTKGRMVVILGGVTAALAVGYLVGSCEVARVAAVRDQKIWEMAHELKLEHTKQDTCLADERKTSEDLAVCRKALEPRGLGGPSDVEESCTLCTCQRGDPLCTCAPGRAFDRAAAAVTMSQLQAVLKPCFTRQASFHVTVTFGPSGGVDATNINPTTDIKPVEKDCLADALRHATVPAFDGAAIRIGKTYWFPDPPLRDSRADSAHTCGSSLRHQHSLRALPLHDSRLNRARLQLVAMNVLRSRLSSYRRDRHDMDVQYERQVRPAHGEMRAREPLHDFLADLTPLGARSVRACDE
jgi:hypothetical protein